MATFRAGCRAALVIAPCMSAAAIAAEAKPDAVIRTRAIEASVMLAEEIRREPALAAESLAEGRKWIEKQAAEAAASLKQDPQLFRSGPWECEREYTIRSVVAERYVSVLREDYVDGHGAHPNSDVNTILWDRSERRRISIRPFFTETADNGPTMTAMHAAVLVSLKAEKKKRDASETATAEWFKELRPSLTKIGAVTLAPSTENGKSSGLTFHYPPYAVGPYAEGDYVAFVPWASLKRFLSPEGLRIFAGERPRDDEDEQQ